MKEALAALARDSLGSVRDLAPIVLVIGVFQVLARIRYGFALRLTVATAVGVAVVLGVLRILTAWSLPVMIISGYVLVVVLTAFTPADIVGIAYDVGPVTTSTVTVPLVAARSISSAAATCSWRFRPRWRRSSSWRSPTTPGASPHRL